MNSKGIATWVLALILGIFGLIVVLSAFFAPDFLGRLDNAIPDFLQNDNITRQGTVGYRPDTDSAYYFAGNRWVEFPAGKNVSFGDVPLTKEEIVKEFGDYYYGLEEYSGNREKYPEIELPYVAKEEFFEENKSLPYLGAYIDGFRNPAYINGLEAEEGQEKGAVYGTLVGLETLKRFRETKEFAEGDRAYGFYRVSYDNGLFIFSPRTILKSASWYEIKRGEGKDALITGVVEWRDKSLDIPIKLNGEIYCVKNMHPYFFVEIGEVTDGFCS